jgi:hypothetical protein
MDKLVIKFIKQNYFPDLNEDEVNTIKKHYLVINDYPRYLHGNYKYFISNELSKNASRAVVFIATHRKLLKHVFMNRLMRKKLRNELFNSIGGIKYTKTKREKAYDIIINSDFYPLDKYECVLVDNYLKMLDRTLMKKKMIQDLLSKLYKNRNITYEYVDINSIYNRLLNNYL